LSDAATPIDGRLFLFELAPAPFAVYVPRAPEQEIAEMRRQIAELKAEAAQADNEDKDAVRSRRS
jgi:hypothetical protein